MHSNAVQKVWFQKWGNIQKGSNNSKLHIQSNVTYNLIYCHSYWAYVGIYDISTFWEKAFSKKVSCNSLMLVDTQLMILVEFRKIRIYQHKNYTAGKSSRWYSWNHYTWKYEVILSYDQHKKYYLSWLEWEHIYKRLFWNEDVLKVGSSFFTTSTSSADWVESALGLRGLSN